MARQPHRHSTHVEGFVRLLFAFDATLYSALTPMLPHYASSLSVSRSAIGVLAGAYPAGMMGGALLGRAIARAAGARRTIIVALLAFAAASAPFGFVTGLGALCGLRFLEGMACGCLWCSGLAWVVSVSPSDRRGSAIGSALSVAVVGTLIGPVIGTLSLAISTKLVFLGVAAVSIILALRMRRYAEAPEFPTTQPTRWRTVGRNPRLLLGLWLVLLDATSFGALGTLLPLRLGHFGASSIAIGATFLLAGALSIAAAPVAGRMSDRFGPRRPLAVGLGLSAVLIAVLVLPQVAALLGVMVVLTIGGSLPFLTVPAAAYMTSVFDALGIAVMTATMLWNLAWSAGETIGAPAGAALSQAAGNAAPFLISAALMLVTYVTVRRMISTLEITDPSKQGS
jgi:MFS family permease